MKAHHLCVLEGQPSQSWLERAKAAFEAGYEPDEIADATFGGFISLTGSAYEFWKSWSKSFDELTGGADEALQPILLRGAYLAGEHAEGARRKERWEETYGDA